jgi:Asp-tRNA(Asn)/Glu-tRNA(Gln) amidotransferase A subunit family amidase
MPVRSLAILNQKIKPLPIANKAILMAKAIGIQIIGKRWREMELLAIAQEIDQIVGRFQRPPDY